MNEPSWFRLAACGTPCGAPSLGHLLVGLAIVFLAVAASVL